MGMSRVFAAVIGMQKPSLNFARVPQSASPWTDGGLCDVCQPSHGNFLLADLSNQITYQLAKQRALLLYILLVFNLGSQGVATTAPACRCG